MSLPDAAVVGRRREVAALRAAIAGARSGDGSCLMFQAPAGGGTTRLASEAGRLAAADGLVVGRGRATASARAVPYRPLAEALLSLLRRHPAADWSVLGPYRAVLGHLVPDWRDADADPATLSPVILGEGLLRVCAAVGAERGCLLVLEDLDDADAETLNAVEYVVDNAAGLPLAVVVTMHAHDSAALALARAARQRGTAEVLALPPLSPDDVTELAAVLLEVSAPAVPDVVLDVLHRTTDGSPLLVVELVQGMIEAGGLVPDGDGWRVESPVERSLATSLARSIDDRLGRLEPLPRDLLRTASVIGERFPLSLVQAVHDLADQQVLECFAGANRLIRPDDAHPDWYRFHHPVFAEVVAAGLTHAARSRRAAAAAAAVSGLPGELPAEWTQLAVGLFVRAGEPTRAARLLVDAAQASLAAGAAASAVELVDRAQALLGARGDETVRIAAVETLLTALTETGQIERALSVAATVDARIGADAVELRAEVHLRLAWAARVSGRWADSADHLDRARSLMSDRPAGTEVTGATEVTGVTDGLDRARLRADADIVDAYLHAESPDHRDIAQAETLARRAIAATTDLTGEPALATLACRAWQLLGVIARETDLRRADECFDRVRDVALGAGLTTWTLYGLVGRAGNEWLGEGELRLLGHARDAADRAGARFLSLTCSAIVALGRALRGDLVGADALAAEIAAESASLNLDSIARYATMVRLVCAGHSADREAVDLAFVEMRRWGAANTPELGLAEGLGSVVCALLQEDRSRARAELVQVARLRSRSRTGFFLCGDGGLALLLDAVEGGPTSLADIDVVLATAAGGMRWNRHFLLWARAVILAREGRPDECVAEAARARAAGEVFPGMVHLAARLAAEAVHEHGVVDAVGWLRNSEAFFDGRGIVAVASSCRSLLRHYGVSVHQRRAGTDRIPAPLRRRGVTLREFEVLELLRAGKTNRAIAERLTISPRTAEKHVASALMKLDLVDRTAVTDPVWWHGAAESGDAATSSA